MHWIKEAFRTNWVTTIGENIDVIEQLLAGRTGRKHAVALASGTTALHLAIRLAGQRLYGKPPANRGTLYGHRVFCTDLTFSASVNPVAYENGTPVFIDTEPESWNMSTTALKRAFEEYPDVRLIVIAHLYGTPANYAEIRKIADLHGALIVEDAAEAIGSKRQEIPAGSLGDISILSFNGNKIITGSSGGMLLTGSEEDACIIRKWSTQSRESVPWYHHKDIGYNYRMSNIIAGIIRGQIPYVDEHITRKREIYESYTEGLKNLPVTMNPIPINVVANHWLSCMTINPDYLCTYERSDDGTRYLPEQAKTCPDVIHGVLHVFNVESRPLWKPMHMQPIWKDMPFITAKATYDHGSDALLADAQNNVGADLFRRGICLPSDIHMTNEQQSLIIEIIRRCFN